VVKGIAPPYPTSLDRQAASGDLVKRHKASLYFVLSILRTFITHIHQFIFEKAGINQARCSEPTFRTPPGQNQKNTSVAWRQQVFFGRGKRSYLAQK